MIKNTCKYLIIGCYKQVYSGQSSIRSFTSKHHNNDIKDNLYSILNPYIDFEKRLKSDSLLESITQRKINIDLGTIVNLWKRYKIVEETKFQLENIRSDIATEIKSIAYSEKNSERIQILKDKGKKIRQDLKTISSEHADLELNVLSKIYLLPNDLENGIYENYFQSFLKPNQKSIHHLDISKKLDIVEFISPMFYFLKNEAAEFELQVTSSFFNFFIKHGFLPFSNPDFSRTLALEGCIVEPNSLLMIEHEGSDQYFLNGTAALLPFCSFHSKHISEINPIRYVTQGRHYVPVYSEHNDGLYSVCQNNAVQIFVGSSQKSASIEFNNTLELILNIYKQLGLHFKVVKMQPPELKPSEACSVSIQIHSPYNDKYIEVGNLSYYGEFISKKLRMYYKENDENKFLSVISGTVLKIPPLLASFLENKQNCEIPKSLALLT